MDEAWRSAWTAALDDLELTLDATERLLRGEPVGEQAPVVRWTPPSVAGPPPPDLLPRARMLLSRQQNVINATTTACAEARHQIALLARLNGAQRAGREHRPVYLDVTV